MAGAQGNAPNANQGNVQPWKPKPTTGGGLQAPPQFGAAPGTTPRPGVTPTWQRPEYQALQAQAATAPARQPRQTPWDPTGVTKSMNGQRVVVDQTGNTMMGRGGPMLAGAQGQATGQVLSPQGTPTQTPSQFQQIMDKQYGQGNPFGQMGWYGNNPLETAQASAQRALDQNLAGIRARYGAAGTGNSARAALAEGQALGDFATGFGDVAAQRGLAARSDDLSRLANLFTTSGSQDLQAKELALRGTQGMANLGTGFTGIGAQEQGIPNIEALLSWLGTFSNTRGGGRGGMTGGK